MVSTRSSARKPPRPLCPSASVSVVSPVVDDPPHLCPRRSPRIRIRNEELSTDHIIPLSLPSTIRNNQPISSNQAPSQRPKLPSQVPTSRPTLEYNTHQQHECLPEHDLAAVQKQSQGTKVYSGGRTFDDPNLQASSSATQNEKLTAIASICLDSSDEAPEEVTTGDAKRGVDESQRIQRLAQTSARKRRRRRRRRRELTPDSVQRDFQHYEDAKISAPDSTERTSNRLSSDAIAAAQVALQSAELRHLAATKSKTLKKQVRRVGRLKASESVGDSEVAVLINATHPVRGITKRGRRSAASFLISCIQSGPKRLPSSNIARKEASTKSRRV